MARRDEASTPDPWSRPVVIEGRLTARLLGLPLLAIDAHVVVAPASAGRHGALPVRGTPVTADGHGPALRRAARLLAEGSSALDDARRIRRQAGA
jgi:hypothetical protein